MSHQVQLSAAASHCPTAVLDPGPARRSEPPGLPQPMAVLLWPNMRRILSHPGNPICTAFAHTPKIPGQSRDRHGTCPCGPATVRWQARSPRRGSGARTPRATGPPNMPGHPRSGLPAKLMTAPDLRGTPQVPAIDLPQTRAASGRRPAPTTPPAHPILHDVSASRQAAEMADGHRSGPLAVST